MTHHWTLLATDTHAVRVALKFDEDCTATAAITGRTLDDVRAELSRRWATGRTVTLAATADQLRADAAAGLWPTKEPTT